MTTLEDITSLTRPVHPDDWTDVDSRAVDTVRVLAMTQAAHGRLAWPKLFAPAIRMSGKYFGGIVTQASYANYRLVVEYRWGLLTWEPRKDRAPAADRSPVVEDISSDWNGPLPSFLSVRAD